MTLGYRLDSGSTRIDPTGFIAGTARLKGYLDKNEN